MKGAMGRRGGLRREPGVVSVGGRDMAQQADPLSFAPIK